MTQAACHYWDGSAALHCTAASFETSASRGSLPYCTSSAHWLAQFCRISPDPARGEIFLADLWMQGTALAIWGEGGLRRPSCSADRLNQSTAGRSLRAVSSSGLAWLTPASGLLLRPPAACQECPTCEPSCSSRSRRRNHSMVDIAVGRQLSNRLLSRLWASWTNWFPVAL